jgi:class 3 adenylate cyclase
VDVLRDSFPTGLGVLPRLEETFGAFVDPSLETAYQSETFPATRRFVRFSVTLSVLAFLAYGVHDAIVIPSLRETAWWIRFGIVGPLGGLLIAYTFKNSRWQLHQGAMFVFGMTVNTIVFWIGAISAATVPEGFFIYTSYGIVFVTLGPFLARMNAKTQIIYTLASIALYNVFDLAVAHATLTVRLSINVTLFTMGAIGMLAARRLEIQSRLTWLQRRVIKEQMEALDKERRTSESLLLNVLPRRIADRLKGEPGVVIADRFESATVLFCDIVGFTQLSARLTPDEIVRRLDSVFSCFDTIAEALGLEKIKTIGDAYMVAGGVPAHRGDHADAVCDMALRMRDGLARLELEEPVSVRIGVHTGPVVAGVIGKRKFIYDVWGDTVNTASRMESHGLPGRIQVSEATYEATKASFEYEPRGVIDVKGKGEMRTYLLVDRRAPSEGRVASLPKEAAAKPT